MASEEAKPAIVFTDFFPLSFGPGGLRATPVVADGSEAGHYFHQLFSFRPGGLRAPPVVADESEAGHC